MPVYTVQLTDGRRVKVEGDRPPTEQEVLAELGNSQSQSTQSEPITPTLFPSSASSASGVPLDYVSGEGEPESAIPALKEVGTSQLIPWSPPAAKPDDTALGPPSAALYNTFIKGTYDFMNTPFGLMTAGVGAGPTWLKRLAGLAFAEQMTEAASEKAGEYSVTKDPTTGFEALFSAAPIPFLARPTVGFGHDVALTKGDVLEIGSRELLKDVEGATLMEMRPPWGNRTLGVSASNLGRAATDALASPEAQSAVDLAYRQMQPGHVRLPWERVPWERVPWVAPEEATRRPRSSPSRLRRDQVESGMHQESGYYLDEPRNQSLTEPPKAPAEPQQRTVVMPVSGGAIVKTSVLSNLQKSRLRVALQRGASADVIRNILRLKDKIEPNDLPPEEPSGTPVETPPTQPKSGPSVTEGIDFENIKRPHRVGVERGLALTETDVPALEEQKTAAYAAALEAASSDPKVFKANFGKGTYLEGVIEGAKRQGPNYEAYLQEQAGKLPEGQPTEKAGTTEASPASGAIEQAGESFNKYASALELLKTKAAEANADRRSETYEPGDSLFLSGLDPLLDIARAQGVKADMQYAGTGSHYLILEVPTEFDKRGEPTDYETRKYRVADHEASIFREKQLGRNTGERILNKTPTRAEHQKIGEWLVEKIVKAAEDANGNQYRDTPWNPQFDYLLENATAAPESGGAGIKTPSETQSREPKMLSSESPPKERPGELTPTPQTQADKGNMAALQSEDASALTAKTSPQTAISVKTPDLVERLERWKYAEDAQGRIVNPQGQLFSLPHPDAIKAIGKTAWNNAIDVAIVAIKAGKSAAEAINHAIGYLKKQASGFDENKIRENLSKLMELEAPRVEGDKTEMRKSAARATNSPQIPEPVQERIAQAPESSYKVQPMKSVEEAVSSMPDADLAAVPESSNIHVAAKLELSRRLFDAGKLDEGYEVFKQVSKTGTDFGQNINQFKFLKGQNPLNVVHLVNQGLKESGRDPLTKPQAEALAKSAQASIDANKALESAKDAWLKNPSDANAKAADAAVKAANEADLATQRDMSKYKVKTWPQMLKAFAQGNPLTPISQVANVVGNSLGAAMEAGSRGVAASLDAVRSMLTGSDRTVAVQPVRGSVEAAKGFGRGLSKAPSIMVRGSGDVVKGDVRAQLQPLRSLVKAFSANPDVPTVEGKVPFVERARLAVEGTFGIAPEIMLRMLAAADKPAYESARARLISEQSNLQKLTGKDATMAQKFPELFFDRDTLKRIQDESAAAVFQRKSKTVSYLENLIKEKGGDWADLAFTLLVAPYRLTPWNLVGRTLIYNPLIAALRTGMDAAKGNTRAAEINAGRMVVGGMLYTAGYFLYKNGLIGPSLDSRDEQQKARLLSNEVLPPNHVNVDGLRRLINGGNPAFKPGDETWDLTRGGGAAGAILSSVANIGRDFEKKPEASQEWVSTLLKNSTLEQASFTINQSFLKGVTGILDAVRDRNLGPYMNSVENMLLNVPTPNTLSTLSRATRQYVPDVSADKLGDELSNVVRNRFGVAGLDDYLPLKRDLWGKPMLQTPEGRNALLYHLFDISKNKQVTDDPVALELYQVWRETSDPKAIPSIPMRNVTFNKQTYLLNPKQYERYAELTGQYRRQITEVLVTNPNWQNLDNENKIKILDAAYGQGQEIGKALLLKESLGQLSEKQKPAGFKREFTFDIDLTRPKLKNPDGSFSTERTITVESDGKHYVIPTIVGGKQLSMKDAVSAWKQGSNKPVGVFDNANEAERYAVERSKRIGELRR